MKCIAIKKRSTLNVFFWMISLANKDIEKRLSPNVSNQLRFGITSMGVSRESDALLGKAPCKLYIRLGSNPSNFSTKSCQKMKTMLLIAEIGYNHTRSIYPTSRQQNSTYPAGCESLLSCPAISLASLFGINANVPPSSLQTLLASSKDNLVELYQ